MRARLIAEFAADDLHPRGGGGRHLEGGSDFEVAAKDGKRLLTEIVLFHLGLGVGDALHLQRRGGPGEAQRDEVIVGRGVAVDVKAIAQLHTDFGRYGGVLLGQQLRGRGDGEDITLRRQQVCRRQQQGQGALQPLGRDCPIVVQCHSDTHSY